jgi:hypothetical protein
MVLEDIASGSQAMLPALLSPRRDGSPARPADARLRAFGAHYVAALTLDSLFTTAEAADVVMAEFGKAGIRISYDTLRDHHRAALARQPDLRSPRKAAGPPGDGSALALFDALQAALRAKLPARWQEKAGRLAWLRRSTKSLPNVTLPA